MKHNAPRSNMKRKFTRKKGPVRANKVSYDGINFASGLEKYMYMALRKAKIAALYEGETFELQHAFEFPFESFERTANGKGDFINRGNKKILNIKYTPDFVGKHFIIETKGRANESFPMRWKLFKKYIAENKLEPFTLYKPQNHKECDIVVALILERQNKTLGSNT
mgnify:FL=1